MCSEKTSVLKVWDRTLTPNFPSTPDTGDLPMLLCDMTTVLKRSRRNPSRVDPSLRSEW